MPILKASNFDIDQDGFLVLAQVPHATRHELFKWLWKAEGRYNPPEARYRHFAAFRRIPWLTN
jgi:hypothetical protein